MELKQTRRRGIGEWNSLLIVPYGIETEMTGQQFRNLVAFNRTLWN